MSHRPTLPCAAGQAGQDDKLKTWIQGLDAGKCQMVEHRWKDINSYAKELGEHAVWLQLEAYKLMWEVQQYKVQLAPPAVVALLAGKRGLLVLTSAGPRAVAQ